MTNISMPDPVACLWIKGGVVVNAFNRPPLLHDGDPRNEYFIKKGFTEEPLITTTQAEAYADAKVREALEDLVDTLEKRQFGGQDQIVNVIRNLIPPLPGPVEPTT